MPSFTASPTSFASVGLGIPWQQPANAVGSGIGLNLVAVLTGYSITGNVVTFSTTTQIGPLVTGQIVTISGLTTGTFLNGQTLTVLASGLTTTSFKANFTHANVSSTQDSGFATPTTTYTFANNNISYTPPVGQYTAWAALNGGNTGISKTSGSGLPIITPWAYATNMNGNTAIANGLNGDSFAPTISTATTGGFSIPTLPVGAVIQSIVAIGSGARDDPGGESPHITLTANYPGGSSTSNVNNGLFMFSTLPVVIGDLPNINFQISASSSINPAGSNQWSGNVSFFGIAVNYTLVGSPPPSTQLQTLEGTNCGFAIPGGSFISGIEVTFQAGLVAGLGACTIDVQLSIAGTPVGTVKSLSAGSWNTFEVLGGASDIWGTGVLTTMQVNGSNGLGVNIFGTLSNGAQINLNSLLSIVTVFAGPGMSVVWINVGNTRKPTVGG